MHLGEVDMAEQCGDPAPLSNVASTVRFRDDLHKVHYVCVICPPCHFGQQPVVPDVVKIAAQVDVYDACLVLNDGSGPAIDRFMSCPFGTISKRARLEVGLEDRLQYELERTLHHPVPDRRN